METLSFSSNMLYTHFVRQHRSNLQRFTQWNNRCFTWFMTDRLSLFFVTYIKTIHSRSACCRRWRHPIPVRPSTSPPCNQPRRVSTTARGDRASIKRAGFPRDGSALGRPAWRYVTARFGDGRRPTWSNNCRSGSNTTTIQHNSVSVFDFLGLIAD